MALDPMNMPDPGHTSTGPMGFWDTLLSLSQQSAARGTPPGLGGMVGNAVGGQVAPGLGYAFDWLGQGWSAPKPLPQAPQMPEKKPLPQGGGMGNLGALLSLIGLL